MSEETKPLTAVQLLQLQDSNMKLSEREAIRIATLKELNAALASLVQIIQLSDAQSRQNFTGPISQISNQISQLQTPDITTRLTYDHNHSNQHRAED